MDVLPFGRDLADVQTLDELAQRGSSFMEQGGRIDFIFQGGTHQAFSAAICSALAPRMPLAATALRML